MSAVLNLGVYLWGCLCVCIHVCMCHLFIHCNPIYIISHKIMVDIAVSE